MNKKIRLAIIGVAAAAGCAAAAVPLKAVIEAKIGVKNLPDNFTITAHTGCCGAEANTLESSAIGFANGADISEFDLNVALDGTLCLSHDTPKEGEAIVPLQSEFEFFAPFEDKKLNVDVKTTKALDGILEIAEKTGVKDRIFYTGIGIQDVAAVKAKTPEIPYYLNCEVSESILDDKDCLQNFIDGVKETGAIGLNMHFSNGYKKLIEACHENGLEVSLWTAYKVKDMLKCLAVSPDNITTTHPDTLRRIINILK